MRCTRVWILDCRFEDGCDEKKHSDVATSQAVVIFVIAPEEALGLKWDYADGGASPKGESCDLPRHALRLAAGPHAKI